MKQKIVAVLFVVVTILACQKVDLTTNIGDFFVNSQTDIVMIDTFTLQLSTLKISDVPTSQTTSLLTGKYTDEYFGEISATAYFQISPPDTILPETDEVFDSIVVNLSYDNYIYGDTLLPHTINIYRVLNDIEPDENNLLLYQYNSFELENSPIGSSTFKPKPNFTGDVNIRLNDEIGIEFFNLMKNEADEMLSSESFLEYFKGLALVPHSENNAVLSFFADSMVNVTLYSHIVDEYKTDKKYIFEHNSSLLHFNQIEPGVTAWPVNKIVDQKNDLKSSELNNMAFIQSGNGIVTRINFPGLYKLLEINYKNILYKAELILKPFPNSNQQLDYPEQLILFHTDKYNNLVQVATDADENEIIGYLEYDEFYHENTQYKFDITNFIFDELSDAYVDAEIGVIVLTPEEDFYSGLNRVVFDARSGNSFRPVLQLYYVFYQ